MGLLAAWKQGKVLEIRGHKLRWNTSWTGGSDGREITIYVQCETCKLVTSVNQNDELNENVWTCQEHIVNQIHRD